MTRQSTSGSDWIISAFKQNPEGLLLLAAGAVLLMRKAIPTATGEKAIPTATEEAVRVAEGNGGLARAAANVKQSASEFVNETMETASAYASSAADYAGQAGRAVGEQSERVMKQARSTWQSSIGRVVQEQPLTVAIAGLAAGAAVAALFPSTDVERKTLGPIGDQVSDVAGRVGDQLKEATARAGETLKTAAEERGLTKEGLKEVATEAAEAFSNTMGGRPSGAPKAKSDRSSNDASNGKPGDFGSSAAKQSDPTPRRY